jgi:hypothetical protein
VISTISNVSISMVAGGGGSSRHHKQKQRNLVTEEDDAKGFESDCSGGDIDLETTKQ